MGWREWADSVMAAGLGPDDIDEPDLPPPSFITVCWIAGYEEVPIQEDGYVSSYRVPMQGAREFPIFMSKASGRFFAYLVRKYGKENVWDEVD